MKENEVRISEVPPGSVLLMGDVAVFSVEEGFLPAARLTMQRADGRGPARDPIKTCRVTVDGEVGRGGSARTSCPKRVTCE